MITPAKTNQPDLQHKEGCGGESCNCAPTTPVPQLTPISRMFLMIAGAMFGLFLLKYFGVATS
jgi:hypothetical protein